MSTDVVADNVEPSGAALTGASRDIGQFDDTLTTSHLITWRHGDQFHPGNDLIVIYCNRTSFLYIVITDLYAISTNIRGHWATSGYDGQIRKPGSSAGQELIW